MVEIPVLPEILNVMFVQLIVIVNIIKKIYIHKIHSYIIHFSSQEHYHILYIYLSFLHTSNRGDFLTNINCSLNCIYQKDGKCSYSCITPTVFSTTSECAYFVDKSEEETSS